MDIELLVVPDCPNEAAAAVLLRAALDDVGLQAMSFNVTVIHSQQEADAHHFVGSPTITLDGADAFPLSNQPASLACRLYRGANGLPDPRDLRQALESATATP